MTPRAIGRCLRLIAMASPGSSCAAIPPIAPKAPRPRFCRDLALVGALSICTRRREVRRAGGCGFQEAPECDALHARILWRAEHDRGVVTVDAIPAEQGKDSLDIRRVGVDVLLLSPDGGSRQLLLSDGPRHIHLALREGSLLDGPVRLRYALEGLMDIEPKLLTVRRLAGLWRLGRMPAELFPRDPRARRWIEMLRALDASRDGASQRDIAAALFGAGAVRRDWRAASDYLRLRIQRLARNGEAMLDGGYLRLVAARVG